MLCIIILVFSVYFQYKSDLYTRDHEGLGPLDITMKDRALIENVPPPGIFVKLFGYLFSLCDPQEVE